MESVLYKCEEKVKEKKMKRSAIILLLALLFLPAMLFANPTKITSISIVPANPTYGDLVQITVNLCEMTYGQPNIAIAISTQGTPQTVGAGGQVFVVDANGVDRKDVAFPNGGSALGLSLGSTGGPAIPGQCQDCGGADGFPVQEVYTVHMPTADYFANVCNPTSFYVIVGSNDYSFNAGQWSSLVACGGGSATYLAASIPVTIPPPSNSITKRYEGSLTTAGDEVLYAVDYSYGGSGAFSITDPVPGGGDFTVAAYGPTGIPNGGSVSGPAIGATSGTYVWNFPARGSTAGMQSGTIWMLLKLNNYTLNKVYTNTATTAQAGVAVHTSSASVTSGVPAISISKTENVASLMMGQNITYVLTFDINGYALKNFQPFDNIASGTYSASPPPGWKILPYTNGDPGTWTIHDPCNTGGSYITGSGQPSDYPGLLLDDGGAHVNDQFCTGMIVSDFYIEDSSYSGADAQVLVRSNYQSGTNLREIGVFASIDANPAVLMISLCGGVTPAPYCGAVGPAGSYTNTPSVGLISSKKWYRMRIVVTNNGTGQEVKAKVWARGDPEIATWDIDYVIPNVGPGGSADWDCSGSGTTNDWRPGINQQTGDGASVQDSYDNFLVYAPRVTAANTAVYDTMPTGVTYVGQAGGCTQAGGIVNCNIGSTSLTSGSFTWWGTANTCASTISNQGLIFYAAGSALIASNWVSADVLCWSPTFTPTITIIPGTPTFTCTWTNTATVSKTYTITNTPTFTPAITAANTQTATPTFAAAACTPVSAILCAAVDDYADIWINSTYIDNFPYVPWDQTGVYPKCVALPPAVASALSPTNNMIAVRDLNTSCCEIWASWSLDITCSNGMHSYASSNSTPSDMYWDNNGCPATDPAVSGGHNWYDALYNESGSGLSWTAPVIVTGQKFGKMMSDPGTGNVLPSLGYSAASSGGTSDCMQLFFRQSFSINTMPTPMPPVFTIAKTASQTTGILGNQQITFSVHICNTGGGTSFNPVHIIDTWTTPDTWAFQGFIYGGNNAGWSFTDPLLGYITTAGNGPPSDILFNDGFNGNTCFDLAYVVQDWTPATQCITWLNSASLQYLASPGIVSTVSLIDLCPSATPTFTASSSSTPVLGTPLPTSTVTITFMPTMTVSKTFTQTNTATVTGGTPLPTGTFTRTTLSGTSTWTMSQTGTPTFTASWTPVSGSPVPTSTFTPTNTPPVATGLQNLAVLPGTVSPGQNVTITFQFLGNNSGCKTAYFAALSNQCAIQAAGTAGQAILVNEIGINIPCCISQVNGGRMSQCNGDSTWHNSTDASCGMEPGGAPIYMTVPGGWAPGTYYAIVAARQCNIYANPMVNMDTQICVPFTVAAPTFTVTATSTVTVTPTITETVTQTPVAAPPTTTSTPTAIPVGTPYFTVSLDYSTSSKGFITVDITSSQLLTGPVGVSVYVNVSGGSAPVFYYNVTQSASNPLEYVFQYPKQSGLGDITGIVVTGTDAAGTGVSDGSFTRAPAGSGNVWCYKNVFNPDRGERCGVVFRHKAGNKIHVKVYNKRAACIKDLVEETAGSDGLQQLYWDGTNDKGEKVVSAIYLIVVDTGSYKTIVKVALIK
jgi:hypothetical protein